MLLRFSDFAPGEAVRHQGLVAELHHRVVAAGGDRRLADLAHDHVAAIAQHVIPEHLDAGLAESGTECPRPRLVTPLPPAASFGGAGDALGGVVDALRERGAAMRGVHDHLEGVAVGLQQLLVAFGQLGGVLAHVPGRDREQRLVVRVRIGVVLARAEVRESPPATAEVMPPSHAGIVPSRIAGLLGAQRRELGTQLRGIGGRRGSRGRRTDQHARQHREAGKQ